MRKDSDKGVFEINLEDAPRTRNRPATAAVPAELSTLATRVASLTLLPTPVPLPTEPGGPPGGQAAVFFFADGTTVEFTIPYAIGVAGYGDSEIAVAWWTLMDPSKVILNQGPLLPMLAKKARQ